MTLVHKESWLEQGFFELRLNGVGKDEGISLEGAVDGLTSAWNDTSGTVGGVGDQRRHCIAFGIRAEEEEAGKKKSILRKELYDLSGDGGFSSPSGAIEPEYEGVFINLGCCPINDLVDNGDSRVLGGSGRSSEL